MKILTLLIEGGSEAFREVDGSTQLFININIIQAGYALIVKPSFTDLYTLITNNQGPIEMYENALYISILLRYVFYYRHYIPKEDLILIIKMCADMKTQTVQLANILFITVIGFISIR